MLLFSDAMLLRTASRPNVAATGGESWVSGFSASAEQIVDHSSVHISQSVIPSTVSVGQPLMVDSQQMQNCGMKVVNMDPFFGHSGTDFIRFAIACASARAAAGQP